MLKIVCALRGDMITNRNQSQISVNLETPLMIDVTVRIDAHLREEAPVRTEAPAQSYDGEAFAQK